MDPEENLERVAALLHDAAARGAELTVFPECALTGYFLTAEEAQSIAEPIPGPRIDRLGEAVRKAGCLAVVGTIERGSDGRCYNTAVLLAPEGLLGRYRKTHLIHLGVDRFLTPENRSPARSRRPSAVSPS